MIIVLLLLIVLVAALAALAWGVARTREDAWAGVWRLVADQEDARPGQAGYCMALRVNSQRVMVVDSKITTLTGAALIAADLERHADAGVFVLLELPAEQVPLLTEAEVDRYRVATSGLPRVR